MLKRLILRKLTILAVVLTSLPISQAQIARPDRDENRRPRPIQISSYEDDPFVREPVVKRMDASRFGVDEYGRRVLRGNLITISEEPKIYREEADGTFTPLAWNPWPAWKTSNQQGDFRFQDEVRFPPFELERGPDGKPILKDGLQVWTPNDLHLGDTTAFEAANAVKAAAEAWAGRDIGWGVDGQLDIESHAFVDFNAFYSSFTRSVFFGVVPYRLPGTTDVKIFEIATSWDMAAHESGHAVHHPLKPNAYEDDQGFNTWGESFGDQMAMWGSLRDRERVSTLLAETGGNFDQSNSLTRMSEAFAALTGKGTGLRDAFNDKKISDTTEEVHNRSEALTGAAYKLFLAVYSGLKNEQGLEEQDAMREAGDVLGTFLVRATDFTPENKMTLEDVAKAYLKVDKEFFGSRYRAVLVDEFIRREIFDADSVNEWFAHEAATPSLCVPHRPSDQEVEAMLQANLDNLGIGPDYGLKLQSVTTDSRFWQTIVRVQLTLGRGEGATALNNHGALVFRWDGSLADYHSPLPLRIYAKVQAQTQAQAQAGEAAQFRAVLARAKRLGLDRRGVPLSLVRKSDGQLTVEARVMRGEGLNAYMEVFTPDNPRGERRGILISPVPPDKRIPISEGILN